MNGKSNLNSVLFQVFGQLCDSILSLSYCHTISRDYYH
jgi:hypothetical protein